MSGWPNDREEGYKQVPNKDKPGGDLWESMRNTSVTSCKAACNSNSRCKSIAYRKSNGVCWLKTYTENDATVNTNDVDMYYKQGEPVNDKNVYFTKGITPVANWKDNGSFDTTGGCNDGSVRIGGCGSSGDRSCSWMPKTQNMCPNVGQTPDDFMYFRHTTVSDKPVEDYDWGAYSSTGGRYCNFQNWGSRVSIFNGSPIVCGYNRIDRNKWSSLGDYFDNDTINKIKTDYCTSSKIDSNTLYNDSKCKSEMQSLNKTTYYYRAILSNLKNEPNWWSDDVKVKMLESIATNSISKQDNDTYIADVINSLPTTGWSDQVSKSLNAILLSPGVSSSVSTVIANKTAAFCNASNRNSNEKCGCYNAIDYGLNNCKSDIKGCEEIYQIKQSIDTLKSGNEESKSFGSKLESDFYPETNAKYCRRATATDTILRYKLPPPGATTQNFAACFNNIQNYGNITADTISSACSANVESSTATPTATPTASFKDSSSSGTSSTLTKNSNTLIIVAILCCFLLLIGIGVVMFI